MSDRPSVLFVCVHNAGRSQMAAAYLTQLGGDRVTVRSAGSEPADRTSTRSPARACRKPAAIWERPALWTQTNRTVGLSLMRGSRFRFGWSVVRR